MFLVIPPRDRLKAATENAYSPLGPLHSNDINKILCAIHIIDLFDSFLTLSAA